MAAGVTSCSGSTVTTPWTPSGSMKAKGMRLPIHLRPAVHTRPCIRSSVQALAGAASVAGLFDGCFLDHGGLQRVVAGVARKGYDLVDDVHAVDHLSIGGVLSV